MWDFHERAAAPHRALYGSGLVDRLRSQAATDRLVDALLIVAGRAGDAERVAFTPFEQRGDDDALDEAVRIAAVHGFRELFVRDRPGGAG